MSGNRDGVWGPWEYWELPEIGDYIQIRAYSENSLDSDCWIHTGFVVNIRLDTDNEPIISISMEDPNNMIYYDCWRKLLPREYATTTTKRELETV